MSAREVGLRDLPRLLRQMIEPDLGSRAAQESASAAMNASLAHPAKRKRARPPTLAQAFRQAEKAGRSVTGAEVYADHVRLEFGALTPAPVEIETPEQLRKLI